MYILPVESFVFDYTKTNAAKLYMYTTSELHVYMRMAN